MQGLVHAREAFYRMSCILERPSELIETVAHTAQEVRWTMDSCLTPEPKVKLGYAV